MLKKLCNYYLECLDQEEVQTHISFPSRVRSQDYAIQEEGILDSDQLSVELLNEQGRDLIRKARMDQTREIMAGYPVRTRNVGGILQVQPILLFEVDQEGHIWWQEPQVNTAAIMDGPSGQEPGPEQSREAADHFARKIGILEDERTPSPREFLNAIRRHRPDWEFTNEPRAEGLRNNVILFSTARKSNFTKGLRAELGRLTGVQDTASSALGHWIGSASSRHRNESPAPVLEILPMNGEQRRAVDLALRKPLTVVTGPPGTGKSQVIVNLLASAANAGQTVLFASKNNKAVDVVRERFDEQCQRPILFRLGWQQEDQLRSQITGILAVGPNPNAEQIYQDSVNEKMRIQERIRQLTEQEHETIRLRNETDELERRSEEARNYLPKEAFLNMTASRIKRMETEFNLLLNAARDTRMERHGFVVRLLWSIWFREDIFRKLHNKAQRAREMASFMGSPLPRTKPDEGNAAEYEEIAQSLVDKLPHAEMAARYQEKLRKLWSARRIEDAQREKMWEIDSLVKNDRRIWENWIDTQPNRMGREERENLLQFRNTIERMGTEKNNYRDLIRRYEQQIRYAMKKIPCWAVTSLSTRGRLPLHSGFFDILVIDEASQCDIASALPLLYRAKRAVIIGDPKQLRHICKIRKQEDLRLQEKHGLGKSIQWSYSQTSLFDIATALADGNIVQLRDHHRSHPDIIGFSNWQFYGGELRMATNLRDLKRSGSKRAQPAIRWLHQAGSTVRPASGSAINAEEANAVVETVRKLVLENNYQGTIGVVTPYRKQSDRIRSNIAQDKNLSQILNRKEFTTGTAHTFQGDERDLIIFSPVISQGAEKFTTEFAQKENLLNVAVTRARAELIIVGDQNTIEGWGNIHKLRLYAAEVESRYGNAMEEDLASWAVPNAELVSPWEKRLHKALNDAGINPIPQYQPEYLNYYIDLAVIQENRRLAIEVDGEHYHKNWDGELCYRDQIRNQRLISEGWDVMRFWVYEIRDRLDETVEKVKMWVAAGSRPE